MKLLLITGSERTYEYVSRYIKPLGFDLIWYRHILKAMDNIDEVDPEGIIISAGDFPRHWKPLVQLVRSERDKDACPIILLTGSGFSLAETSKAQFLMVNGIVPERPGVSPEGDQLQSILSRYVPVEDKRKTRRFHVNTGNRLGLIISNPVHTCLVPGEIKTISKTGVSFSPAYPSLMEDIQTDQELPGCSLRAGDAILSPVCRVIRAGRILSLEFISFPEGEQAALDAYLEALPLEEFKSRQREETAAE
jgi:hypothetical protein